MRNRRSAVGGYLAGALAAIVALRLGSAFVAPAAEHTVHKESIMNVAPALVAGVAAGIPQTASAAELRDNGFGVAEIAAIIIPWIFVGLSYFEWESLQPPTDNVTGVAVLGDVVDAPPGEEQQYFNRSPESG